MKKRILILTGILVMVVVSFTACGSKSSSSEPNYEELQEDIAELQNQLNEALTYKEKNDILTKNVEELNEKVERLQESKSNSTSASSLESEANSTSSFQKSKEVPSNNLVDLLFWEADAPYEMKDKNFQFYSDKSCEEKFLIKDALTFANYFDYEIVVVDSDGETHNVYISMSREKGLVFSKERPYFNEIEQ
ncbi:MAG: hypothetical protein HFJ35_07635 [Clostridia bacterium]|nr:hypothetical protein [Clostridia bacterium]